jgi:hypothetical protein
LENKVNCNSLSMTNSSASCPDCERLSADYESATIRWFRLDSQMQIAQFGLDPESSDRIGVELARVDEMRKSMRQALRSHISIEHGQTIRAFAA